MSIRDYIEKKKNEFFVARDADKRELQEKALIIEKARLAKEREELQGVRDLQAEVRKERDAVHSLKTQGSRDMANRVFGGLKRLNENVKRFGGDEPKGGFVQNVSKLGTTNPDAFRASLGMGGGKSPFAAGPSKPEQQPKKQGKTITIHVRE